MKFTFSFNAFIAIFLCLLLSFYSCTADELPSPGSLDFCDTVEATYNASVKAIIDSKCAVSSCHGGPQQPNLTDFNAVNTNSDRISVRALDQQTMPPASMPALTNDEIDILNCWREAGFPEE